MALVHRIERGPVDAPARSLDEIGVFVEGARRLAGTTGPAPPKKKRQPTIPQAMP
jgi:hypothetical protein